MHQRMSALCQSRPMHRSKQHLYSITSSARVSSVDGMVTPSASAVLRNTDEMLQRHDWLR